MQIATSRSSGSSPEPSRTSTTSMALRTCSTRISLTTSVRRFLPASRDSNKSAEE